MGDDIVPGAVPVSLNEARSWLRMGATIDDAVVAGLIRAATNICEAFIGKWLVAREGKEILPLTGGDTVHPGVRPIMAIDAVTLLFPDGTDVPLGEGGYRPFIDRDGTARVTIGDTGGAVQVEVAYRAGMAEGVNGIPEAIRQGILRMVQHLNDARDDAGAAPPAAIAALWQPWRRLTLGGGR